MKLRRLAVLSAATILTATSVIACSSDSSGSNDDSTTIRIGTTDSTLKVWAALEEVAENNGLNLDLVNFSDYSTPNVALAQGEIDVNLFQHLKFLSEYNAKNNGTLTPVSSTAIYPLGLYWKDHNSLDGIEGEEVVIPNDTTNQGRAINVLVQAGLITLKEGDLGTDPTPADIDQDASKVKVVPVTAEQTTASYGEGKPAIINNSFLSRAGIDPTLAVYKDNPDSELAQPYINVFVTRADNATDENILKLAKLWHDPSVVAADSEDSGGTSVEVVRPASDLKKILDQLEAAVN
ncbi:ABC-type metal ion transport system, periplasmic component/surface antigen [Corynebacterium kutscheri]|uniref:ABC-type metal ion transport system, periplasmic component/surface antigen n=1 Tax=Corynebacterium kutscheri TaxID=35755 RepID=A0A0F6TCB3_9CORY|nr:MetQ/NlpA family ABC transporter substrate-binding protein [Corynebacterium kutscheri]AKE40641.1 ABC-type metal ion transport system, periplasmic component/surface antigen [Corynebacterium kutscheri]VEH11038.1 ABC-type transporter, periplasmic component [Corynebacterium kutscheri]